MAQVLSHQMMEMPDKRAVDDASLTTDGIGMIRESFAKQVRASLGLSEDTSGKHLLRLLELFLSYLFVYIVFQARLGGIKGLFCAYPDDVFDELVQRTGKTIAYRSSMCKYDCDLTELEVCNVSRNLGRARLSVNLILLLLSMGVHTVVCII